MPGLDGLPVPANDVLSARASPWGAEGLGG